MAPDADAPLSRFRIATPGLFETLGIPLLRGRTLAAGGAEDRRAAVVSEDLVRRHFPEGDALGRRLYVAGDTFRIVGVVPSIRDFSATAESPFPFVYVPVQPATRQSMALVVRTAGDPAGLVAPLRRAITEVAPRQPVTPLLPMRELIGGSAARPHGSGRPRLPPRLGPKVVLPFKLKVNETSCAPPDCPCNSEIV